MSYQGAALHKSLGTRGRASGILYFTENSVCFENETIKKEFPLSGLQIKIGEGGVKLYYFKHYTEPEWSFYTSDKTVLNDGVLLQNPDLYHQLKSIKSINSRSVLFILSVIAIFICTLFCLYILKTPLVNLVVEHFPVEWEKKLGDIVYEQYKTKAVVIDSKECSDIIKGLTQPLLEAIPETRYDYDFHIVSDPIPNAFALPGGTVVIHSGLIEMATSSEEVLGVIAHEIAHVQKRHGIKQMVNSLGLFVIVEALVGDYTGVFAVLLNNGSLLLTKKYSRNDENEADNTGVNYLVKAGINPEGLISFFKKLDEMEKRKVEDVKKESDISKIVNKLSVVFDLFSTHPSLKDRIINLEKRVKKSDNGVNYKKSEVDITVLKEVVLRNSVESLAKDLDE